MPRSGILDIVCGLRSDLYSEFHISMLKVFMDDSGSGGDSPWYVLAGYVGTVDSWIKFEGEWAALLSSPKAIEYFKASQAESRKDQFDGFSIEERNAKLDGFVQIVNRYALQAVYVRTLQRHYDEVIKGKVPPEWDSPYYLLLTAFILSCTTAEKYLGQSRPMEFVLYSSQRFEKTAERFDAMLRPLPQVNGRVANIAYRDEKEFLPLQAADLLAWQTRRFFCANEPERPQFHQALMAERRYHEHIISKPSLQEYLAEMQKNEQAYKKHHTL